MMINNGAAFSFQAKMNAFVKHKPKSTEDALNATR